MIYVKKRSSAYTSFAYRYSCLTQKEGRSCRKLKRIIAAIALKIQTINQSDEVDDIVERFETIQRLKLVLLLYCRKYHNIAFRPAIKIKRRKNRAINNCRTIDSFTDNECWKMFRTRKLDLTRLMIAFQIDDSYEEGGIHFSGEEVLLIGLHRYAVVGASEQTMGQTFSLDFSMLSRAFKIFNKHILDKFTHLLFNNLDYWTDHFETFSNCIARRLSEVGDVHYDDGTFRVAMFHDDTVIATCRPGSGPAPDGGRHDNFIQMAFYNGWKKHHGYKFQTLEFPNGMCGDMFGPYTFRHNDLELLRDSDLNARLATSQM